MGACCVPSCSSAPLIKQGFSPVLTAAARFPCSNSNENECFTVQNLYEVNRKLLSIYTSLNRDDFWLKACLLCRSQCCMHQAGAAAQLRRYSLTCLEHQKCSEWERGRGRRKMQRGCQLLTSVTSSTESTSRVTWGQTKCRSLTPSRARAELAPAPPVPSAVWERQRAAGGRGPPQSCCCCPATGPCPQGQPAQPARNAC